jgi:hypothetical protein
MTPDGADHLRILEDFFLKTYMLNKISGISIQGES